MDPYRLPAGVRPSHYRIMIAPDLGTDRFEGSVVVTAEVTEPSDRIVLNADGLTINAASVRPAGDSSGETLTCTTEIDEASERLTVTPPQPLAPGPVELELSFSGAFNEQLVGLYASTFTTDDGTSLKLATTQFEATHARKCFPCWDEPEIKATFGLTLVIDEAHDAVANSAEVARRPAGEGGEGKVALEFATTMKMSTYLVAFVAGPIEKTEAVDVDGTPLRVVHVPGKGELTEFALETGAFALRYFADYFDLRYPGDKVDLVAIPDFAFGAMENLGCITFREVALLIDPATATQAELQRVADVINHELAHMWFGDLVTMKWWNGLWLNEAFATFMEMRCTDAFRPGWQRWVDFSLSRTAAFDTDSLASTRPIEFEVVSPTDAEGMFDILTYEKGAAVVRMLEQYIGEDRFRDGIRRYMTERAYGNAETTDLWDAIEAETGEPVRRIMDSWIFQGGYPLVAYRADGPSLTLTQQPMAYAGGGESTPRTWAAPVLYRWKPADADAEADGGGGGDGGDDPASGRVLLDAESASLTLDTTADWVALNAGGTGFLRVAYTDSQLDRLATVALDELSAVERYALVDDAYASVLAGRTATPAFLNLVEAMSGEHDRSVWQRLIGGLNQLDRLVNGEARERLQEIAHDILAPPLANLGLAPRDGDDDRSRQLRGDLVRALGIVANDPEIQEEAKRAVATGRRNPGLVDAALMAASVDVVASVGDEADFSDFIDSWKAATNPQEERRYLFALADFSDPALIERIYTLALDRDIRSQDAPFVLGRAMANRHTGQQTWDFISGNWDRLLELFPTGSIVRMLQGITTLNQPGQPEATAAFFTEHDVPSGHKTLTQLLEKQQVQAALRQREQARLTQFLTA